MSTQIAEPATTIRRIELSDVNQVIERAYATLVTASQTMSVEIDQLKDSLEDLWGAAMVIQLETIGLTATTGDDDSSLTNTRLNIVDSIAVQAKADLGSADRKISEASNSEKDLLDLFDSFSGAIRSLVEAKVTLDAVQRHETRPRHRLALRLFKS